MIPKGDFFKECPCWFQSGKTVEQIRREHI